MSLAAIKRDIYEHIATYPGLPTVLYPNVDSSVVSENHLRVFVLPADTRTVGLSELDHLKGVVHVNVFVRDGEGELGAIDTAELVLKAFPRNLELNNLRIDEAGTIGHGAVFEGWLMIPVKIPYQHLS